MNRYIDADKFHEWVYPNWSYCAQNDDDFHNAIDAQPTADVAPIIHAHWIIEPWGTNWRHSCSNPKCNHYECHAYEDYHGSNYCPNCGAKMDEEVKDET